MRMDMSGAPRYLGSLGISVTIPQWFVSRETCLEGIDDWTCDRKGSLRDDVHYSLECMSITISR